RQLSEVAGTVYDRPLLMFELDHGGASEAVLTAAQASLVQRSDAAGHDLVAWAAYRLGDPGLARKEIEAALASGIRDARVLYHAGAITIASGDPETGRSRLEQALALGPALGPADTTEARRLLDG